MLRLSIRLRGLPHCIQSQKQRLFRWSKPVLLGTGSHTSFAVRPVSGNCSITASYTAYPISEREYCEEVTNYAILDWYHKAKLETAAMGAKLTAPDDPDTKDLLRELDWLLEDASGLHWPTYKITGDHGNQAVRLRVSWGELQGLWQLRLHDRVPLQYLTHAAHWRGLVLAVGPGALIPRPETECLIDFAAEAAKDSPFLSQGIWADLGTGSGALAVGMATALPSTEYVVAVDLSEKALDWAALNVQRLKLDHRVQVRRGSWWAALEDQRGQLSGVLTNPPYIEPHVMPSLQAEVGRHEPSDALDGGGILGMDCLTDICAQAADFLRPNGFLGIETGGPQQTVAVSDLLAGSFHNIKRRKDMYGVERFVIACRNL